MSAFWWFISFVSGRGFVHAKRPLDRVGFERGRAFHPRGRGRMGRFSQSDGHDFGGRRPFRGRGRFGISFTGLPFLKKLLCFSFPNLDSSLPSQKKKKMKEIFFIKIVVLSHSCLFFPLAGGRRGSFGRSTYDNELVTRSATSSRFELDRPRPGALDIGHAETFQYGRHPFPERDYGRPFGGRHFDDSYEYDGAGSGLKRTFSMMVNGGM